MIESTTFAARLRPANTSSRLGGFAVLLSAIGFGLSPFLASRAFSAGVEPTTASLARVGVLAVVTAPFALGSVARWWRQGLLAAAGGAVSVLGFTAFLVALERSPMASTVVYYTYPAVVVVFTAIIARRRPSNRDCVLVSLILVGVLVCIGPAGLGVGAVSTLAIAAAAPLGWAGFMLLLSGPLASMPTVPKLFAASCGGVLVLAPFAIASGVSSLTLESNAVSAVLVLAVCSNAIPAALITWSAPIVGARMTAMVGSVEFVVAIVAGWLFLHGNLGAMQLLGALIVLGAAAAAGVTASMSSDARLVQPSIHADSASASFGRSLPETEQGTLLRTIRR